MTHSLFIYKCLYIYIYIISFFVSGISFAATNDSQDRRAREGSIFYPTLPLPPLPTNIETFICNFACKMKVV